MDDSKYYVQAIDEFTSGRADDALLAKAYALAEGDAKAQEFQYIQLRVAQLRPISLKDAAKNLSSAGISGPNFDNVIKVSAAVGTVILGLFVIWCVAISLT